MKKAALVFVFLSLILAAPVAHAVDCYSPREVEAEQGLRIHSELMVIALTCMKMPQGQATYGKYQAFTQKNKQLINDYESTMIRFYRSQGASKPDVMLHSLRTALANEISQHAISMSMMSFCKQFTPRIENALAMDGDKIRRWAQHVWPESPTTLPQCKG